MIAGGSPKFEVTDAYRTMNTGARPSGSDYDCGVGGCGGF